GPQGRPHRAGASAQVGTHGRRRGYRHRRRRRPTHCDRSRLLRYPGGLRSRQTFKDKTMRAVLTISHGGREALQYRNDVPNPQPHGAEALVCVAATSVNYHDIFTRRGMPGVRISLPVIAGSDIAGTVLAAGPRADAAWVGKRVLIDPVLRQSDRIGMLGETLPGGRAELIAVAQSMLVELPEEVSFEQAASLPLAYGTAHRMMVTRGEVKAGERVLVLGASGGVGVACVQIAKL